ncbi:MAG: hypothetical protein DDT25_01130 [Chloroflexi bacterium]|nr:hypothetical protein [Chloroflexota bacterium]
MALFSHDFLLGFGFPYPKLYQRGSVLVNPKELYALKILLWSRALVVQHALDIDGDGIPNIDDRFPTIHNTYIHIGGVALFVGLLGTALVVSRNRRRKREFERERKRRIEREKSEIIGMIEETLRK